MLVNVLLTLVSFVVAIGILVAVHEWGHFAMARACGAGDLSQPAPLRVGREPAIPRRA